jgi:hypothetical protein
MGEHYDWDWRLKRNVWDSPLLLVGGGALVLLILIGVYAFYILKREHVEEAPPAPPPAVEPSPSPIEAQYIRLAPFLLVCVVGIWLLVVLVAILVFLVWTRLPERNDMRGQQSKNGKPPPSTF